MTSDQLGDESGDGAGGELAGYATGYHSPVLCKAVVDGLITNPDGTYADATLGGGGHAAALLDALSEKALVVGMDRDERARAEVQRRLAREIESGRLVVLAGSFGHLISLLASIEITELDGVLLDLGVSSHQLDDPKRGFSYSSSGELDMRMDRSSGTTAADIVNHASARDLERVLRDFGEEGRARRIVAAIVSARPVLDTGQLANIVRFSVPRTEEVKSLSRVFQALRIAVNRELDELESALKSATHLVRRGGRMAAISYHSLEDRRVKRFLRYGNFAGQPVKDVYGNIQAPWSPITPKPITPGAAEIEANPRSRSARLRIGERTEVSV